MTTRRQLLALLLLLATPAYAGRFDACTDFVRYGDPGGSGTPLCRLGYAALHDNERKISLWVVERLTAEQVAATMDRTDNFRPDMDVPEGSRASLLDYRGSGYDRGHLAPAADMRWSPVAMSESFLLSNMVPQVGTGMNRGIWKDLEAHVRDWATERGEVYVFTGPAFGPVRVVIGPSDVEVPAVMYKVVFDPIRVDAIAFLMPNRVLDRDTLPVYRVSIDTVEQATGLDFLSVLRDDVEVQLESSTYQMW